MSRVNKYRAWREDIVSTEPYGRNSFEQKFMENDIEDIKTREFGSFEEKGFVKARRVDIMQYIGIGDKNGKEVYERDIVRQYADCTELGKNLYLFYVVEWSEEYCAFVGREICSNETYLMPDLKDIEVIGNVYENADLLKEVEISE